MCACRRSSTPVGPRCLACTALRCCLPLFRRRRLPLRYILSGLNHAAYPLAVYASQPRLPVDVQPRKTRFRALAGLLGRAWLPAGTLRKVSISSAFDFLLSQAWPGAPKLYVHSMFCSPDRDTPDPKCKAEWSVPKFKLTFSQILKKSFAIRGRVCMIHSYFDSDGEVRENIAVRQI